MAYDWQVDLFALDETLDSAEREIRDKVRGWVTDRFIPRVQGFWRDGDLPAELSMELGALGCFGSSIEGYGCPGLGARAYGIIMRELERGDSGLRTFASVQGALAMNAIAFFGTEEQKQALLPGLAEGKTLGCFALTEPGFGSNPGGLQCRAVSDGSDWVISGEKKWIGNADIADFAIVWGKVDDSDRARSIRAFVVPTKSSGFTAKIIPNKLSLRCARTAEIQLDGVRIPQDAILPGTEVGLRSALTCLDQARYGIAWGVLGAAEACLAEVRAYVAEREVFERQLASYQLVQDKLAGMLTRLTQAQLTAFRLAELKDCGEATGEQISLAKYANVEAAQEIARTARDLLGGVGILDDFASMRHMCNLESVATYEGTRDVHRLVLGRWLTGIQAFR